MNNKPPDDFLKEQPYEYKSVFLYKVVPDSTNPRFLPAIIIGDQHAMQLATGKLNKRHLMAIYRAKDHVLIGKGCAVNCFDHGTTEWKKANESIESIIELAANVSISELIQVPTIYPTMDGSYQVLTGHRRFFAMIFAKGINGAAHFKVYDAKPTLPKTKQFQENASREDLPQYGKLLAFQDAMVEIEALNALRLRSGFKPHTVRETASLLGISMGAYDNYNVLTRYQCVRVAYEQGNTTPFVKMKKLVLMVERNYKEAHHLRVLNVNHRKAINDLIDQQINGKHRAKAGAVKKFKFKAIESPDVLKTILSKNVMETVTDVDWHKLDWNNHDAVNEALQNMVEYLSDNVTHA